GAAGAALTRASLGADYGLFVGGGVGGPGGVRVGTGVLSGPGDPDEPGEPDGEADGFGATPQMLQLNRPYECSPETASTAHLLYQPCQSANGARRLMHPPR